MARKTRALFLTAGLFYVAIPVSAQKTDPPPPSNLFQKLFPNPTGTNGYEEMVKAADASLNSAAWREAEQRTDKLTLAEKRRLVSDPEARQALNLLNLALTKPISTPHKNLDDETVYPELAQFRSLARLISMEMFVQLADGKVGQAIDAMANTLRFGYIIQSDTLIAGLVGIAVDSIGMRMISDHLDQLSARDCDRLITIANQWLELPDPSIELIAGERESARRILQKYRSKPDKLFDAFLNPKNPNPLAPRLRDLQRAFSENPSSAGPVFDDAGAKLTSFYDKAVETFRKPVWERADLEKHPADDSPSGLIAGEIIPIIAHVSDRYGREQALVQLLAVHAAIRRYRWETENLPDSLEALRLGRLAIDPFTGKSLTYKKLDDKNYEISSIGPLDRSQDAVQGARVPIR